MPQVFKIGSYWVYFGQMKMIHLSRYTFMLQREARSQMQQRSGLPEQASAFLLTIIQIFRLRL